jgi:hypothetical protein
MGQLLKLPPDEKYLFQINSTPSCEECELYAQDLRDFFNSIEGWNVSGSPLIFASPVWRTDILLITKMGEENMRPVTLVKNAFRAADIKIHSSIEDFRAGTFVIVIGRER